MATEVPYPASAGTQEVVVAYSLREIIDQINKKLDLLPTLVLDQASMKDSHARLEARVLITETKLDVIDTERSQTSGVAIFKDKFWAKFVGLAGIMGMVAGITVQILNSI